MESLNFKIESKMTLIKKEFHICRNCEKSMKSTNQEFQVHEDTMNAAIVHCNFQLLKKSTI